jgi:hypothetical protein
MLCISCPLLYSLTRRYEKLFLQWALPFPPPDSYPQISKEANEAIFFYSVQIKLTMIRNQGEGIAGVIQKTYLEAITKHRINRQPISQGRKVQVKIFLPPLLDPSHD